MDRSASIVKFYKRMTKNRRRVLRVRRLQAFIRGKVYQTGTNEDIYDLHYGRSYRFQLTEAGKTFLEKPADMEERHIHKLLRMMFESPMKVADLSASKSEVIAEAEQRGDANLVTMVQNGWHYYTSVAMRRRYLRQVR